MAPNDAARAAMAQIEREQSAQGGDATSVIDTEQTKKFSWLTAEFESKEAAEAATAAKMRDLVIENERKQAQLEQMKAHMQPAANEVRGDEPIGYSALKFQQELLGETDKNPEFSTGIDYALRTGILGKDGAKLPPGAGFALLRNGLQGILSIQQERQSEQLKALQAQHPELPWDNPEVPRLIEEMARKNDMNPANPLHREAVISMLQTRGTFVTRQAWEERNRQLQAGEQPQETNVVPMRPNAPPRAPQGASPNLSEDRRAILAQFERLIENAKSAEEAEQIHHRLMPQLKAAGLA